ncbi:hypothetical protein E2C01_037449 [Portunus trituberculatus]|uniref:Uncharacterized protein n=1 Tax=Portunus trituberculatus TaxID=210409 RepID=A0A5B7FEM6_PORTR|nr:hypothetical protein [Portunus trituberculatus]
MVNVQSGARKLEGNRRNRGATPTVLTRQSLNFYGRPQLHARTAPSRPVKPTRRTASHCYWPGVGQLYRAWNETKL